GAASPGWPVFLGRRVPKNVFKTGRCAGILTLPRGHDRTLLVPGLSLFAYSMSREEGFTRHAVGSCSCACLYPETAHTFGRHAIIHADAAACRAAALILSISAAVLNGLISSGTSLGRS